MIAETAGNGSSVIRTSSPPAVASDPNTWASAHVSRAAAAATDAALANLSGQLIPARTKTGILIGLVGGKTLLLE